MHDKTITLVNVIKENDTKKYFKTVIKNVTFQEKQAVTFTDKELVAQNYADCFIDQQAVIDGGKVYTDDFQNGDKANSYTFQTGDFVLLSDVDIDFSVSPAEIHQALADNRAYKIYSVSKKHYGRRADHWHLTLQ